LDEQEIRIATRAGIAHETAGTSRQYRSKRFGFSGLKNANWRVMFRMSGENVELENDEDYH